MAGIGSHDLILDEIGEHFEHIPRVDTVVSDQKGSDGKESKAAEADPPILPQDVGYPSDCFDPPPPQDFFCGICREVARNPANLPCPHLFCHSCLIRASERVCPICRAPFGVNPPPSTYAIKLISALPMRCPNHAKGCGWKGTIGFGEARLLAHLREHCSWGGYELCAACHRKIRIADREEHVAECLELEAKCQHCDFHALRKKVKVHVALGEFVGALCAARYQCPMEACKASFPPGTTLDHLERECAQYLRICYGCPEQHQMPAHALPAHIEEHKTDVTWAARWVERTTRSRAEVGDLRYLPSGNIRTSRRDDSYYHSTSRISSIMCRVTDLTDYGGLRVEFIPPVEGAWAVTECLTCPPTLGPQWMIKATVDTFDRKALDCLTHHECSYAASKRGFADQPFFRCRTCPGRSNWGCCAVCAVECHAGHDLFLDRRAGQSFCDCGAGDLKLKGTGRCRAPGCVTLPAPPSIEQGEAKDAERESEVVVKLKLRGDLTVDLNIALLGTEQVLEREDDDDDLSDDGVDL